MDTFQLHSHQPKFKVADICKCNFVHGVTIIEDQLADSVCYDLVSSIGCLYTGLILEEAVHYSHD